jgi:hypothetical protein
MRHFLLQTLAVGSLAGGVMQRSPVGPLIPLPCKTDGRLPRNLGAAISAVDVAPIAPNADLHLLLAELAAVQAVSR